MGRRCKKCEKPQSDRHAVLCPICEFSSIVPSEETDLEFAKLFDEYHGEGNKKSVFDGDIFKQSERLSKIKVTDQNALELKRLNRIQALLELKKDELKNKLLMKAISTNFSDIGSPQKAKQPTASLPVTPKSPSHLQKEQPPKVLPATSELPEKFRNSLPSTINLLKEEKSTKTLPSVSEPEEEPHKSLPSPSKLEGKCRKMVSLDHNSNAIPEAAPFPAIRTSPVESKYLATNVVESSTVENDPKCIFNVEIKEEKEDYESTLKKIGESKYLATNVVESSTVENDPKCIFKVEIKEEKEDHESTLKKVATVVRRRSSVKDRIQAFEMLHKHFEK